MSFGTNYRFGEDGKAYTGDNIVVHNLYLYNVPSYVTEADVMDYFTKFGVVAKVDLQSCKPGEEWRSGYVNFLDPLAAANVLRAQSHTLNGEFIGIRACDSWRQQPVVNESANTDIAECSTQLLCLNDDCLRRIYSYLGMGDQIYFALSHRRLGTVLENYCKRHYREFELESLDFFTLWQIVGVFSIFGPYMEKILGAVPCNNRHRIADFMGIWATNVQCIEMFSSDISQKHLSKMLNHMHKITVLHLCNCSLNDLVVQTIGDLPNLELLSLAENKKLTGKFLDRLTTVKDLDLSYCPNLETTYVFDALIALTELLALKLVKCGDVPMSALQQHFPVWPKLEMLKICFFGNSKYKWLARMPNLRQLEFKGAEKFNKCKCTELFKMLSKHNANNLDSLRLCPRSYFSIILRKDALLLPTLTQLTHLTCRNLEEDCAHEFIKLKFLEELDISYCKCITNQAVLLLLSECRTLEKLVLQCTRHITQDLTDQMIHVLRDTAADRKARMQICVYKTGIKHSVLSDINYRQAQHEKLLVLLFEEEQFDYFYSLDNEDNEPI